MTGLGLLLPLPPSLVVLGLDPHFAVCLLFSNLFSTCSGSLKKYSILSLFYFFPLELRTMIVILIFQNILIPISYINQQLNSTGVSLYKENENKRMEYDKKTIKTLMKLILCF